MQIEMSTQVFVGTSDITAFQREGASIPYADEIATFSNSQAIVSQFFPEAIDQETLKDMSPHVVLRHLALTASVKQAEHKTVLELGAGLTPRGLILTEDPSVEYLETDLPALSLRKKMLVRSLLQEKTRDNLHFACVNIHNPENLKLEELLGNTGGLLTIVEEAMFQYLNLAQKQLVALNVRTLLRRRGGVWLSSEILTRERLVKVLKHEHLRRIIEKVNQLTKADLLQNSFADTTEAESFFKKLGFKVKRKRQLEHIPTSLFNHTIYGRGAKSALEDQYIWYMSLH
jgi:O-methyltransferase involved in polyketide biosynthesis